MEPNYNTDFRVYSKPLSLQIKSWFLINERMRPHITNIDRLIEVDVNNIKLNMSAFNEYYTERWVIGDIEAYGNQIVSWLKPNLQTFTKQIGWSAYSYQLKIWLNGSSFEKVFTVFGIDGE